MSGAHRTMGGDALRYLLTGGVVYLVDLATYLLLHGLSPDRYAAANIAGKIAGAATGFVLHNLFTFAGRKQLGGASRAVRYVALLLLNLTASAGLLWLAVERLGLPATPARIAIDILVIAASFLASRRFVFARSAAVRA